jgi:alpha-amylase/alpha-mannosidase (GH57 family)
MTSSSQPQVIIHGHFYQPPRENPWTGSIERQPSAAPYHDWNARITAECYRPNTRSRVLDGRGRVLEVVNNYRHLSFNFGPTLLSYLETAHPETYRAILQADADSVRARGRGNAMAQAYNHMILPLADPRDRATQLRWGITDFRARFRREPEGLWLSETAVSDPVVVDLVRAGVRFIILAPSQAEAFRPIDGGSWKDVSGGDLPTHRSYLLRCAAGDLQVLFYHGELSRAVAFEHLLRNAGTFADRIASAATAAQADKGGEPLVMVCTDGESYGHHEPMGDMCLAYFSTREAAARGMKLTNPAAFLAAHPPRFEVRLKGGEGTAWSCAHGVGRWKADCGCSTGGPASWNQGWRAPLRSALDTLRRELDPLFESAGRELLADPWKARDDYLPVILGRPIGAAERFFRQHARRPLSDAERARVHRLLEMQRHGMLMYTSCGWFFSELSGIETVQNLRYAARAAQLGAQEAGQPLDQGFLEGLTQAKSNLRAVGTGRDLYRAQVLPSVLSPEKLAAHAVFLDLAETFTPERSLFGHRVQLFEHHDQRRGSLRALACRAEIGGEWTREGGQVQVLLLHGGSLRLRAFVRPATAEQEPPEVEAPLALMEEEGFEAACRQVAATFAAGFDLTDMLVELREQVIGALLAPLLDELSESYQQTYTRHEGLLKMLRPFGVRLPPELSLLAGYAGTRRFLRQVERSLDGGSLEPAAELAALLEALGVSLDRQEAGRILAAQLRGALERILQHPEVEAISRFIRLLQSARAVKLDVDEATLQDLLSEALPGLLPRLLDPPPRGSDRPGALMLVDLAGYLNLNTDELHRQLGTGEEE